MTRFAGSYIPTNGAIATRAVDVLTFPFTARPQALTVYLRFVENGMASVAGSTLALKLFTISGTGGERVEMYSLATTSYYTMRHGTSTSSVTSSMTAAPAIGSLVELRGVLYTDGHVQISQTVNGGTESSGTASAALALATAWTSSVMRLGNVEFLNVAVARGVQDRGAMRRLAGVA